METAPALMIVGGSTSSAVTARANAAPPIGVIAEEMGYFPITQANPKTGEPVTVMVPQRVRRHSSSQAIRLAEYMNKKQKTTIYTAYWCPHCARQRELFGREAWALLDVVECAPRGYRAQPSLCLKEGIDGYPTWKIGTTVVSGERELADLAQLVGFKGWDPAQEENVPPPLGSSQCRN